VRFLIDRPSINKTTTGEIPPPSATRTTSLYDLRSVQFGLAAQDESASATTTTAAPDENDRKISIALMIAAVLPTALRPHQGEHTSDYHDKQARGYGVPRTVRGSPNMSLCFVIQGRQKYAPYLDNGSAKGRRLRMIHCG
jgi:hypothetical protein